VESINFALIGGRVVFSELVYSTQNTTIRIVDGTITFRWWVYATRQSLQDSAAKLCRLHIHLSGVEYFLFNNVARYKRLREWLNRQPADANGNVALPPDVVDEALIALPGYFKIFPVIDITLSRASLMIGNPELPAVVLVQAPVGGGVYAADKALSTYDTYKWVIAMQLVGATVSILGNSEFLRDEELVAVDEEARKASEHARKLGSRFRDFLSRLSSPTFMSKRSVGAVPRLVERKARVETAFEDDAANLCEAEVLSCRDITVVYRVDVNGWWPADMADVKPSVREPSAAAAAATADESVSTDQQHDSTPATPAAAAAGNANDAPPEWSITIDAKGAQFNYGPWADRQRALTSRFFFPWDYKPLEHVRRGAGLRREHEALVVTLNLHDEFGIRVPFRTAAAMAGKCGARGVALRLDDADAMASLTINGSDAAVQYVAPMFLNARHGHRTTCRTDATLRTTQPLVVTTSVRNADAPLMRANGLLFRLAMHQQAVWNADNVYAFRIRVREPRIFVTDSDVRVLKQMAADWVLTTQLKPTLGLVDFIPTLYTLDIGLTDFRMHINTNEMNVVDNENDLDDNAHLQLVGEQLKLDIDYPALLFGAVATTVAVRARSARVQVRHLYAEHHTVRLFAPGGSLAPANVRAHGDSQSDLRRDGVRFITVHDVDTRVTYKYHYEVRAGWRDSMQLRVNAASADAVLYGHFLRHMLFWLDNFLGLARKRRSPARWRDIWSGAQPATPRVYLPENEFEMAISVDIERMALLLPTQLYNVDNAARAETSKFRLAVQYVPLFIDLLITTEPIFLRVPLPTAASDGGVRNDSMAMPAHSTAPAAGSTFRALDLHSRSGLRVSGLAVRVHYLFGPAPRELTYQRIISVNIGSVSGHLLPPQLLALGDGFAQLGMHFKDHDNTVTWDYFPQEVPYHTTVRVKIARVQLHVWGGASVVELLVQDGVHIAVDDLRRRTHDVSIDVHLVGGLGATCLVPKTAPAFALAADWRHWREVGRVCLPRIAITAALGPPVDAAATQWQIDYLTEQDRLSKRIWWLWSDVAPAGVLDDADSGGDDKSADGSDGERRASMSRHSSSRGDEPAVATATPPAAVADSTAASPAPVPAVALPATSRLVRSDTSFERRPRSATGELRLSVRGASQRSRANSEADVFGTPEASIESEDDAFASVDDDVAGFIARARSSPRRNRRMTATEIDVARSVSMAVSATRSMVEATAPLAPPPARVGRSPSPRRPIPATPTPPTLDAAANAEEEASESDSWWRENTDQAQDVRDGVYAPLFRLLSSQRPLLRRAQLDETALDVADAAADGAVADERRAARAAFVHERDGVHEFLRRQRTLPDTASAFSCDDDSSGESDTAMSGDSETTPLSLVNPTDIANLHELLDIIHAARTSKKRRRRKDQPPAAAAAAAAAPPVRGYVQHDIASNTAAARVVVDLSDVIEVLLTPLALYAIDDWLSLLCERQVSVDAVLDGLQRNAVGAAASAGVGKAPPPHDELSLAIGLRGIQVSLVQSVRTSPTSIVPFLCEVTLERTRISATLCLRSFVGAAPPADDGVVTLRPKELCHAHIGVSIDGLYACARRVSRNRRAIVGLRPVLPALLAELRQRHDGSNYLGELMGLENEWSSGGTVAAHDGVCAALAPQRHVRRTGQAQQQRWRRHRQRRLWRCVARHAVQAACADERGRRRADAGVRTAVGARRRPCRRALDDARRGRALAADGGCRRHCARACRGAQASARRLARARRRRGGSVRL
jgi:hypothetical protein